MLMPLLGSYTCSSSSSRRTRVPLCVRLDTPAQKQHQQKHQFICYALMRHSAS